MKNIDATNGNVYLDGISYTVTKHLTREEFEQLDCFKKKGPKSENEQFKIFDQYIELCQIGGKMFYPRFYFKGSKLLGIYLYLQEQMRDFNTKRFKLERYGTIFKQWLFEQLGTPSLIGEFGKVTYQYEWGKVKYDVDRGGENYIAIEYKIDKSEN